MKERSLSERIVAILGVLIGSVGWVARLVFSLLQGMLKDVLKRGGDTTQGSSGGGQASGTSSQRGDGDDDEQGLSFPHTEPASPGLRGEQHAGIGGVPPASDMDNVAAVNLSTGGTVSNENAAASTESGSDQQQEGQMSRGIPHLEEPGGDDESTYGSERDSVSDTDEPVADYAGQALSESDIGVERGDQIPDIASSPDNDLEGGVDTYGIVDPSETGSDADEDEVSRDEGVHAASRGWEQNDDDPLAGDPLYGDFESSGVGEEVDLRNDEATDESSAGMHIVDSPNEAFVEDDPAADALAGTEPTDTPMSDTSPDDDLVIDDVTNLDTTVIDEDLLAADATGSRIGGDAASGDLGAEASFETTQRDPGASREPGDTRGAYTGSGVDEFASDDVAADLMEDVSMGSTEPSGNPAQGDDASAGEEAAESAAWASSAGVVDQDLTMPQSADELQSGTGMSQTEAEQITEADDDEGAPGSRKEVFGEFMVDGSESEAVKAPQYEQPQDAGLRDVAADIAENIELDDFEEGGSATAAPGTQVGADRADGPSRSVRGDGSPNCPADYPIKGNARSRIYHLPSDASYEGTVPEFCFATEEDAQAAGFRPRKG